MGEAAEVPGHLVNDVVLPELDGIEPTRGVDGDGVEQRRKVLAGPCERSREERCSPIPQLEAHEVEEEAVELAEELDLVRDGCATGALGVRLGLVGGDGLLIEVLGYAIENPDNPQPENGAAGQIVGLTQGAADLFTVAGPS